MMISVSVACVGDICVGALEISISKNDTAIALASLMP